MIAPETQELTVVVDKLRFLLEQEPTLRGAELSGAVAEKKRLIREMQQALRLNEQGAAERILSLRGHLAGLANANDLVLRINQLRIRVDRILRRETKAIPVNRLDITF